MTNDISVLKTKKYSPIINFYKEKCIFLSGGTGFLGTVNDFINFKYISLVSNLWLCECL